MTFALKHLPKSWSLVETPDLKTTSEKHMFPWTNQPENYNAHAIWAIYKNLTYEIPKLT